MHLDGAETHLKNPRDTVVPRGTYHAWKNLGRAWMCWMTFVVDTAFATVSGKELTRAVVSFTPVQTAEAVLANHTGYPVSTSI